jgi:hypothetical protein
VRGALRQGFIIYRMARSGVKKIPGHVDYSRVSCAGRRAQGERLSVPTGKKSVATSSGVITARIFLMWTWLPQNGEGRAGHSRIPAETTVLHAGMRSMASR